MPAGVSPSVDRLWVVALALQRGLDRMEAAAVDRCRTPAKPREFLAAT
jgi:hypothetical protein